MDPAPPPSAAAPSRLVDEGEESSDEDVRNTSSTLPINNTTTADVNNNNSLNLPEWKTRAIERKQKAAYLASQYPPAKQRLDRILSILYLFIMLRLFHKLISTAFDLSLLAILALPFAFLLAALWADFVSGLLHWACDSYGSVDTPVVGRLLIRSFREHHIDPMAITRHPFGETNGNSILATLPVALVLGFHHHLPVESGLHVAGQGCLLYNFVMCFLTCATLLLSFTNQIHKWAHAHDPPKAVRMLQKMGLILEGRAHQKHHFRPYDRDYCITTGWLNPFFERIDFWRFIELAIERATGAVPRKDDQNWTQPRGAAPKQE